MDQGRLFPKHCKTIKYRIMYRPIPKWRGSFFCHHHDAKKVGLYYLLALISCPVYASYERRKDLPDSPNKTPTLETRKERREDQAIRDRVNNQFRTPACHKLLHSIASEIPFWTLFHEYY